jgi:hypothetical protein
MFNLNNDLSIWLEGIIDYLSTIADAALFGQALTKINLKMDMKCIKGLIFITVTGLTPLLVDY